MVSIVDDNSIMVGGEFDKYHQLFTNFFEQICSTGKVKLVFFIRYGIREDAEKAAAQAIDRIDRFVNTVDHISYKSTITRDDERLKYNMVELCQRFGETIVVPDRFNQSVVQYARDPANNVLALIGTDSAFLAFDGNFTYWTGLDTLDALSTFSVIQVDRDKLDESLQLTRHEMRLHATISNVKRHVMMNEFQQNGRIFGRCAGYGKLLRFAWYVKRQRPIAGNSYDFAKIAADICDHHNGEYDEAPVREHLEDTWMQLDSHFDPNIWNAERQQRRFDAIGDPECAEIAAFSSENNLHFVYHLLMEPLETPLYFWPLSYLKFHTSNAVKFNDVVIEVLTRLAGIVHKDRALTKPQSKAFFKRTLNDADNEVVQQRLVYPPGGKELNM